MTNLCQQTIHNIISSELTVRLTCSENKLSEPKHLTNYKSRKLKESDWHLRPTEKGVEAVANWVEWNFGGGKAFIYGFCVTDEEGNILWEERKKDPFEVLRAGDKLRVRPKIIIIEENEE